MKLRFTICILLLVSSCCGLLAQNNRVGLTLNSGISKMKLINNSIFDSKWLYSSNIGMFYYRNFSQHSSIGLELLLTRIAGKWTDSGQYLVGEFAEKPAPPAEYYHETKIHSTYAALPVFYKISFRKIAAKIGIQAMALSLQYSEYSGREITFGQTRVVYDEENGMRQIQFELGPKYGVEYAFNQNLAIRCEYYHGISFPELDYFSKNSSNRQLTLGLQYSLTTINRICEQ